MVRMVNSNENNQMKTEILSAREAKMVFNVKKDLGLLAIVIKDFHFSSTLMQRKETLPCQCFEFR